MNTRFFISLVLFALGGSLGLAVEIDSNAFRSGDEFGLKSGSQYLRLDWPADQVAGFLGLDFRSNTPLIWSVGFGEATVMKGLDPVYVFRVGVRDF